MSKVGRPTNYSDEILKKAKTYINNWVNSPRADRKNIPKVAGLAIELGVNRDTVYEWSKEHKEFSDVLDNLLALQEEELVERGLDGSFNPTITKMMLTKHGYSDKVETDITTKGQSINGLNDEDKIKLLGLINDETGSRKND